MVLKTSPAGLFSLVAVLSQVMNLVSPLLMDHHKRTASFAVNLAEEMALKNPEPET